MHFSGCSIIMPTDFVLMLSHRCYILIIPEMKANGNLMNYGGRENLDTISFLKDFNEAVYSTFDGFRPSLKKALLSDGVTACIFRRPWIRDEMDDGLDA